MTNDNLPPWTEFFDKEYPRLCKWAEARMSEPVRALHGASDIVGTAIGRIVSSEDDRIDDLPTLVCFLRKRIVWAIIDKSRKPETKRTSAVAPEDLESLFQQPLEGLHPEDLRRLEKAMESMTVEEQQLIVLRYEWQFSYREIAEEIPGLTESKARHACNQAISILRQEFARLA